MNDPKKQAKEIREALKHAMDYCDEQVGMALHDPEGPRDETTSEVYQQAANLLQSLMDMPELERPVTRRSWS